MTVILSTESAAAAPALQLRPWRTGDLPALVAAHRDPALRDWLTTSINDEADARRWLAAQDDGWAAGTRLSFAVMEAAPGTGGRVAGHVVVKGLTPGQVSAEVGYWTAAHARGRGIAPRALDAVSRWTLATWRESETPLERLQLFHAAGNHASCRVAHKALFTLETVLPPQPPAFPAEGHLHIRHAK
jgi:RimJ/RimL family protein N-acetyltransferase